MAEPHTRQWFDEDMEGYNEAVRSLPVLTTSNCSPEVMQHIAFIEQEIVRLRESFKYHIVGTKKVIDQVDDTAQPSEPQTPARTSNKAT